MLQRLLVPVLALGLAACSGLPMNALAPKVSVADVEIKSVGLFEQRFDVGLRVRNPNSYDLTIKALDFDLEVNGRPFAKGESRTPTLIPAESSTLMRVDAIMQSKDLIRQIKSLPPDMLLDGVPYVITGRVKTDKLSRWLPFEYRGVYGSDEKSLRGKTI